MQIAIVDDSSSVRMMISLCLEELGVEAEDIFEFSSAVEALEDFAQNYYDIVFCDLNMPQMNGQELIKVIYEQFLHLGSASIVVISGEEDASYKKLLKAYEVHHFIKKPIQPAVFMHHIRPLVEKAKRRNR